MRRRRNLSMKRTQRAGRWAQAMGLKLILISQWEGVVGVGAASSHRCSAAARGTSTSPLNEDTLSEPENNMIAHILWFSKCTAYSKETHPSVLNGTSSLTRCHWLHWGQSWRKEEAILFFSTWLKLLMDALPKSLHPQTSWNKWCDCMLMLLLVAMHYLLSKAKD